VIGSNNSQVATLVDRKSRFGRETRQPPHHVVVPALAETYERRWCPAEWCNSDLRVAPGHGAAIAQLSE